MMEQTGRHGWEYTVGEYDYENLYFTCTYRGGVYAHCHIQLIPGVAYLHIYIERWGLDVLKEMKQDFEHLKEALKSRGVWRILGTHALEGAGKWTRFLRLLGFDWVMDTVTPEGVPCKLTMMEV